ncbi:MAG: dihydrofolate reductase family protein [Burkholderiaceae bacterium]|nr:dihydrofolate reductase family protein [Burkholderiaceae bacterium]
MRRVVLYIAHSLDGFIAGDDGDLSWLPASDSGGDPDPTPAADFGYAAFVAGVDTVLMGHTTYRFVQAHPPYPYAGTDGIVWSHQRAGQRDEHVRFTDEPVAEVVRRLRDTPGRDVFVVGGRAVIHPLVEADLIDAYRLFVVPVRLGRGVPLWPPARARRPLRLLGVQAHAHGLVEMHYAGGSR